MQALRQHLEASHEYFEYGFAEDRPDVEPEIAIRCRKGGLTDTMLLPLVVVMVVQI